MAMPHLADQAKFSHRDHIVVAQGAAHTGSPALLAGCAMSRLCDPHPQGLSHTRSRQT